MGAIPYLDLLALGLCSRHYLSDCDKEVTKMDKTISVNTKKLKRLFSNLLCIHCPVADDCYKKERTCEDILIQWLTEKDEEENE